MSQNYSLSPYKGHFPGKTKNICQKQIKLAQSRGSKNGYDPKLFPFVTQR